MRKIFTILLVLCTLSLWSQKKVLDHKDFDIWNTIKTPTISNNGKFIMYSLEKGERDQFLKIKDAKSNQIFEYQRAYNGVFTEDSNYAVFTIKAWKDSISELKRRKVKKNKLPKDSLAIFNLNDSSLEKISNIKSFKLPSKWSGFVAYQVHPKNNGKKKSKDKDRFNLIINSLITKQKDTFNDVFYYEFAKKEKAIVFSTNYRDSLKVASVYTLNLNTNNLTNIFEKENVKIDQLRVSDNGQMVSFVCDSSDKKAQIKSNELFFWKSGMQKAQKILDSNSAPNGYLVSSNGKNSFSEDGSKLYFGLSKPPIIKDTTLIEEEIVNVEVWTYNEPRLYTVQEMQVKNDQKKTYLTVFHTDTKKIVQLSNIEFPNSSLTKKGNNTKLLVNNSLPYQLESQWLGSTGRDYSIVNIVDGQRQIVVKKFYGRFNLSPTAKYGIGYNSVDSTWVSYNSDTKKLTELTKGEVFYNELNDSPRHPNSYGLMGWSENDEYVYLYDRYDIWKFNPETSEKNKLTEGRDKKLVYRYIKLDKEEEFISDKKWLLSVFDEKTKENGIVEYSVASKKQKQLTFGPYNFKVIRKAKNAKSILFTKENFNEFPNLAITDLKFGKSIQISNANPQQKQYNWGIAELMKWTSLDGIELSGMLYKPENFDPSKKYPLIVNFYEKSSNRLFNHRAPSAGRSTINYSFYTSRGYVIFNPDVHYRIGYPGESAYNCVIPGVTSLIEKGFIDKDKIGVQGHSWGGYQIAYLVTKTDIFKAAESGAPVPNMISAYGGIRWWTGLSRQFQYEHTQSRIGGTPWEYPQRYIENSPIFNIDKINTPLLIMHNDADGHVPWYQGIEFFVALRRLGKPSWFLNYNNEPHWPVKHQNRKDFNIRMQQYFDYYLKGAAKPVWMERGVPAIEKGINQGLELIKNE